MPTQIERIRAELDLKDNVSEAAEAVARSMERAQRAYEKTDQVVTAATPSFDTINRKLDENARLQVRIEKINRDHATQVEVLTKNYKEHGKTQAELDELLRRAAATREALIAQAMRAAERQKSIWTATGDEAEKAVRKVNVQMGTLIPNLNDIANQLLAGTNPFVILVQQGPTVAWALGGITNAFKMLGDAVRAHPILAIGTAIAAAGAALIATATSQQAAMSNLRNTLRTVTTDFRSAADEIEKEARRIAAATPGIGLGEARQVGVLAQRRPAGMTADTAQMTQDLRDFSKTVASDFAGAVDLYTRLMKSPSQIVQELADKQIPNMNERLREQASRLEAAGRRGEAVNLVLSELRRQTGGAAQDTSPLGTAIQTVSTEFNKFWESLSRGLGGIGGELISWLGTLLRLMNRVIALMPEFKRIEAGELKPGEQIQPGSGGADFAAALRDAEGGPGGYRTVNRYGYTGAYQFGVERLATLGLYQGPAGERTTTSWQGRVTVPGFEPMTQEQFRNSVRAQDEAFRIHLADLDRKIDALRVDGKPVLESGLKIDGIEVNRNSLRAVGHLYSELLPKFIASGGRPLRPDGRPYADANGTTPLDYYRAFASPNVPSTAAGAGTPVPVAVVTLPPTTVTAQAPNADLMRFLRAGRGIEPLDLGGDVAAERAPRIRGYLEQIQSVMGLAQGTEKDVLLQLMQNLRKELEGLKTPHQEFIENLRKQREEAETLDPAQASLNKTVKDYEDQMTKAGVIVTDAMRNEVRTEALRTLNAEYGKSLDAVQRSIDSQNRMQLAYRQGDEAIQQATAREQALEVVRKAGIQGDENRRVAVENLTRAFREQAAEQANTISAQQTQELQKQVDLLNLEAQLIGKGEVAGQIAMSRARAAQGILGRGGRLEDQESIDLLNMTEQLTRSRLETDRLKSAYDELGRIGTQAFDRIGAAITEAFVQGKMKTLDFGNIMRGVFSELVQWFAKMAIMAPIKNMLFGSNDATLGTVLGLFGMGGGGGGGGSGTLGALMSVASLAGGFVDGGSGVAPAAFNALPEGQQGPVLSRLGGLAQAKGGAGILSSIMEYGSGLSSLYTIADKLGFMSSGFQMGSTGGYLSGIGNYLGLGEGGWLSNAYGGISNTIGGAWAGVSNFLGSSINPGINAGGAAVNSMGFGSMAQNSIDAMGSAQAAGFGTYGQMLGGAAGIAGGAYGIYSGIQKGGVGGGFQVASGAISVGMGAATAAGALSMLGAGGMSALAAMGPYGWIAAAVLAIIGALLPGQKPSNREGTANIDLATLAMEVTGQAGEKFSLANRQAAQGLGGNIISLIGSVRDMIGGSTYGSYRVGIGDRDGAYFDFNGQRFNYKRSDESIKDLLKDSMMYIARNGWTGITEAVAKGLGGARFNESLEKGLQDVMLLSEVTNKGASSKYQDIASRSLDFAGNFEASINELKWVKDVYEPLVDGKWREGLSSFRNQLKQLDEQWLPLIKHASALGLATEELTEAWKQATAEAWQARNFNLETLGTNLQARILRGSGLDEDAKTAQRMLFELNARKEVMDLTKQLRDLGVSAEESTFYLDLLAKAIGVERTNLEKQLNPDTTEARRATALQTVVGIKDFVHGLRMSDASPITVQDRYASVRDAFSQNATMAEWGNWNSVRGITGYASEFLNTSRELYGSGIQYVQDFEAVITSLEKIAQQPEDVLTSRVLQEETRTQTQVLQNELVALREEVKGLRREVQQGSLAPARVVV